MTIIGVDGDRNGLEALTNSLTSVFKGCDIVTFADAMNTYKYCVNHKGEVSAAFLPIILRPFDGLKLYELLSTLPVSIDVVFTMKEKSGEMLELMTSKGACRHIVKPITPEKVAAVAREMAADCPTSAENCGGCKSVWCERWQGAQREACE